MIIKILKGRSFSGLLDYLFNSQDKPPPIEMEARSSPISQNKNQEPELSGINYSKNDRVRPSRDEPRDNSLEDKQTGERGETKQEQRGELLITNMAGHSKEELLEHCEALSSLRPDVEVNVLHIIISMPEEDMLSRNTKARIIMRLVELKGLDKTMYAAIEHDEEGHRHTEIHIISSTINFKGRLLPDSFDYDKCESMARLLEKEFDLQPNKSSREAMRRAPTQGEWKQHERTGKLSRPLRLQALVDSALDREVTFTDFKERLNRRGVELNLLVNDDGKVVGSVYEFEGKHIRGRRLGRGYTWHGLQQNWPNQQERTGRMTYESERDNEAFSRSRSSTVGRARGADEPREPDGLVGTISGDRQADGRAEREASAYRKPRHQDNSVGEEGGGTVRYNRSGWQGTARGDAATEEGIGSRSQQVQRASEGDGRQGQRGIPVPTGNPSNILRQGSRDKREERKDGDAVSGNGSYEQRHLQQGERRSAGGLGEDAGASQGSNRRASQRDRCAGAALQDGLQETDQIGRHRDNSNFHMRLDDGYDGRSNVATNAVAGEERKQSLVSTDARAKENSSAPLRPRHDRQSVDSESKSLTLTSAVDKIIQKLWSDSSGDDMPTHLGIISNHENSTKREESSSKRSDGVTQGGLSKREEPSLGNRTSLQIAKNQADNLSSQKLSQEKQLKHTERSRTGGTGRSR
ncbi:MAG TPA: relaxase/mobilization nuclease domain-containing protein [Pyrinomonadaceae bacterium]|nr:relaxase/mobilization nuclease domain-containing protein [Pyrinomonadaceae bacterium]